MQKECAQEANDKLQHLLRKHWKNDFRDGLVLSEYKAWLSVQIKKEG